MRALLVAPYLPTPGSGGRTRLINLVDRLARSHDLRVLAFPAPDQDPEIDPALGEVVPPPSKRVRRLGPVGAIGFYRERLTSRPQFVDWMRAPQMTEAIARTVASFRPDVVQMETTEMGQYLDAVPPGPLRALDLQDVASRWYGRTATAAHLTPKERWTMQLELRRTRRYETRCARASDLVFVSSDQERAFLRELTGVDAIEVPNGVDTERFVPMSEVAEVPSRVLFVGPLTYDANLDGLRWFAERVWPALRALEPTAELEVVGTPVEERFGDGIRLAGRVPDVRPHLAAAPVSIVPVRLGSGTRYKILEALSMERAVVSTAVGAEGLGVRDGEHLAIADEPEAFARAVARLMRDPGARAAMGDAGRRFVAARYDWGPVVARMDEAWERAAQGRRASTTKE